MSKQYLLAHDATAQSAAAPTQITFSLTSTPRSILLANSLTTIAVHSTLSSSFPLLTTLKAHKTGCHHITSSTNGLRAVSVGFAGDVLIWSNRAALDTATPGTQPAQEDTEQEDDWTLEHSDPLPLPKGESAWSPSLDHAGSLLALSSPSGAVFTFALPEVTLTGTYTTHPTFALCTALSPPYQSHPESQPECLLAVSHKTGAISLFSTTTKRLTTTLPSSPAPVRTISFSPHGTLLAAAGDAGIIALYDPHSGEQIAALRGHASWIFSLSWNKTGEYLVSGGWDGKVKVWRVETRECVCTISEGGESIWAVEFLRDDGRRRGMGRIEGFAAGGKGGLRFYREAAGGS